MSSLGNKNKAVAEALVDTGKTRAGRAALYDSDQTGLRSRFQQAKAAVASQFGRRSPEYKPSPVLSTDHASDSLEG